MLIKIVNIVKILAVDFHRLWIKWYTGTYRVWVGSSSGQLTIITFWSDQLQFAISYREDLETRYNVPLYTYMLSLHTTPACNWMSMYFKVKWDIVCGMMSASTSWVLALQFWQLGKSLCQNLADSPQCHTHDSTCHKKTVGFTSYQNIFLKLSTAASFDHRGFP